MPDVLGGAGGKKRQKKHAEEKKSFRPGDLPPRRGREWNPGAGPRPERDEKKRSGDENDGGGGGGGGGSDARLSNVWYEASETLALPPAVAKRAKEPSQREMDEKERVARGALEERTAAYERLQARGNSADTRWLSSVRASGTAADKIAAATVLAQEDPVANLKSLESLLSLLEKARVKGGKRGAVQAVAALQELFRDALLHPDRKLKYFSEQPLTRAADAPNERKRLMYWHVEDLVKRAYSRFVNALDALSRDPLPVLKEKSVKAAYELLRSRPENEKALLDVIVNKLGDPQRRTASNAAHFLLEIVSKEHPAMKRVVAREVEAFCFRRGVGLKSQYYAAVLLNQFPLNHGEDGKKLASQLVEFYFSLFKVLHARSKVRSIQKCFTHRPVSTLDRVSFQLTGELFLYGTALQMASSGTLLLLFRDPAGGLAKLRAKLTETFPGATTRQTHIAHSTLLRAFPSAPEEEDGEREGGDGRRERARDAAARGVSAACERWSARIEGVKVRVNEAWFVREERFSSLDGARCSFRL